MRVLKKKMKEYAGKGKAEKKDDMVEELKRKMTKRKGQYTKQDQLADVKDHRFSVEKEPMYHESKLEKMKNQPQFQKKAKKDDIKRARSNSHPKSVEPPDEETMEEYPPDNTMGKKGKDARKKIAVSVISKKMNKRK